MGRLMLNVLLSFAQFGARSSARHPDKIAATRRKANGPVAARCSVMTWMRAAFDWWSTKTRQRGTGDLRAVLSTVAAAGVQELETSRLDQQALGLDARGKGGRRRSAGQDGLHRLLINRS